MLTKTAAFLSILGLVTVSSLAAADSTPMPHQMGGNQDFNLWNETGFQIGEFHVSLASSSKWGEDVLGKDVLESGEHTHITFHGYTDSDCVFDMMIRKGNGGEMFQVGGVNLCEIDDVAFTSHDGHVFFHKR
jgi:hypothetical protein